MQAQRVRPAQSLGDARHRMEDRFDPRRPIPLAVLQIVERGDRLFHAPAGTASSEHPLIHLRDATAARRGQEEKPEKRPQRELETEVNGAGCRTEPIAAHQAGGYRDARECEAQC